MDFLIRYWWLIAVCIAATALIIHEYRTRRLRDAAGPVILPARPPVVVPLTQSSDVVLRDLATAIVPTPARTDQVLGVVTADRIQLFRGVSPYAIRDVVVFEGRIADDGRAIVGRFRLSGFVWFYCVVACVYILVGAPASWPRALRLGLLVIGVPLIPFLAWLIGRTDRHMILSLLRRVAEDLGGAAA